MIKRPFYLLLLVLILSGCGMTAVQKQQVAQFGSATEAMGTIAETEFAQIRQEVVQMNTERLILSNKQNNPAIDLDTPIGLDPTLKRIAAAKALKSYGTLLNKLATADRAEDIKKAAGDLVVDFDAALDQGLSNQQKDAVTGLISYLGGMQIEKMKKEAAKQIVEKYKNDVDKLADLFAVDFSIDERGFVKSYRDVAGDLKNEAIRALTQGEHPSFIERERALQDFVTAEKAKQKATEISIKARIAISNLKKTNAKLSEILANDNYEVADLQTYAKSIQDFVNLTQLLTEK